MKTICISKIMFITIGFAVLAAYSGQWEVFTNKNDVRDIALSGTTLWAATTGGVVAWNLGDASYTSYTTADGLPSCNINQVAVDNKGRPWVATIEPTGLYFYENDTWKQINVGGDDSEITDKVISGLEVDQFGNVWVYTRGGFYFLDEDYFLWRYDGKVWHKHEGVYGPLALDPQKNLIAVDSIFSDCGFASTARFKIVSFNDSLFVTKWRSKFHDNCDYTALANIAFDSKGNPWTSYCGDRYEETYGVVCNNIIYTTLDGLADDNVRGITPDESGNVWCATDGGISKFTGTSWVSYDTTQGVASNLVYKILIGGDTTLYAATSKGISILKSDKWKTLKTVNDPPHNTYTDMVIDKKGTVIFSCDDHIAMYNSLQWNFNYFRNIGVEKPDYESGFNDKSFFKSNDNTIYAIETGIEKGYILQQGTDENTFFKVFSDTLKNMYGLYSQIGLPAVACSGNDSCFWLTNEGNNLIWLNKQTTTIFPPSGLGIIGKDYWITSMLLDRDGRSVWVGINCRYSHDNYSATVVHFDGDTAKERITIGDGLGSDWVTAIARDSSENLWFASVCLGYKLGGVAVLRNTKLTKYTEDKDGKEFGSCYALFVDKSGVVWTHAANGIARFDGTSWKLFDSVVISSDFPHVNNSYIVDDKSGTVWFGTPDSGLLAYKDNRWYQFTTRDGIPHNSIRSLAVDSKDNLWILTDYGVAMRKSNEFVGNQARHDFKNPENKQFIQQRGNRFYISSDKKPAVIRYTLFDLSGRMVLKQTIHNENSFVLPQNRVGSGVRILSITTEDANKSQKKYVVKMSDIK